MPNVILNPDLALTAFPWGDITESEDERHERVSSVSTVFSSCYAGFPHAIFSHRQFWRTETVALGIHLWIPAPCYHLFLICPAMQGDCSLRYRKARKQLLEEDVDRFSHSLSLFLMSSPPHIFHKGIAPSLGKRCWKSVPSGGETQRGSSPPKNSLVSRL